MNFSYRLDIQVVGKRKFEGRSLKLLIGMRVGACRGDKSERCGNTENILWL